MLCDCVRKTTAILAAAIVASCASLQPKPADECQVYGALMEYHLLWGRVVLDDTQLQLQEKQLTEDENGEIAFFATPTRHNKFEPQEAPFFRDIKRHVDRINEAPTLNLSKCLEIVNENKSHIMKQISVQLQDPGLGLTEPVRMADETTPYYVTKREGAFHRNYKALRISPVSMSADDGEALMFSEFICGELCGEGSFFLFEMHENRWRLIGRHMIWIS